jgi:hypothetical protein
MFAIQAPAQEVEQVKAALVVSAIVIAVFWRLAIRVLLVIILVALGAGAFALFQGMRP